MTELFEAIEARTKPPEFLRLLEASKRPLLEQFRAKLNSSVAAKALTIKTLNAVLAHFHFVTRSAQVLSRPLGLVVDPINNCNLACPGCVHSTRAAGNHLFDWNSGMLSASRFEALLRQYGPHALEIMLCNYGEPLMNPLTPQFIRIARSYQMRTGLSTNMTPRRFDARAYVDSGLDFMTVSLDGATQAVYERYRRKGDLESAFENIRSLIAARKEAGRRTPIVSWQFLAFEHNVHEIDQGITIARQLGIDQFTVAIPFDVSWDEPGIRPAQGVEPRVIHFTGASDDCLIENWPTELRAPEIEAAYDSSWIHPLPATSHPPSEHTCQWLYRNLVMDANGRVLPCCAAPKPGVDLVFDRFGESTEDSFNAGKFRLARTYFASPGAYAAAKSNSDPYCVKCEWNQDTAHTDSAQVEQYFRTVPGGVFDRNAIAQLANW